MAAILLNKIFVEMVPFSHPLLQEVIQKFAMFPDRVDQNAIPPPSEEVEAEGQKPDRR